MPILQQENETARAQAQEIQVKTANAQQKEVEAAHEASQCEREALEINELKQRAERELSRAQPALVRAAEAVNELSKDDIAELKVVSNPTRAVELALMCTLTYLRSPKTDWATAQKTMTDIKFLDRLRNYDKDQITPQLLSRVQVVLSQPDFSPEVMARASKAAGGLARWCRAIALYAEAHNAVRPLLARQLEMTQQLEQAQAQVAEKAATLQRIKSEIEQLEEAYRSTTAQIEQLGLEKTLSERRLKNASTLKSLLEDEKTRWQSEIKVIQTEVDLIEGNILLSACSMSY